jgi:hypothetical protein
MYRGGANPPNQIEKKSFGRAKIRKNNKIWGKILIFLWFGLHDMHTTIFGDFVFY